MTEACFNSKIAKGEGASKTHNEREWTDDHPAPEYVAEFAQYADPRGNEQGGQGLTRDQVRQEYIDHTEYGRRTGKAHARVKLFREAVINCTAATQKKDVEKVIKALEKGLNIRSMGWHLHRDEGHLDDETGKPKCNYHIHLAYTNLKDGQVTHMDKTRMKKAQDICAQVLKMPRGKPHTETGRVSMDHKQYRQHARALAAEEKKTRAAHTKIDSLTTALTGEKNGRQGEKTRAEKAEAELKKQKAEYKELGDANRTLRQRLKDSGQARQEDYQAVKRIMTDTTMNQFQRIEAATNYVAERAAYSEPADPKDLVDVNKDVAEPSRYINATPSLGPVVRELVGEKEKRQKAESAVRAADQRVEVLEKALPETGWTMPKVKTKKEKNFFGPDQRVETETATLYRQRVRQDIDLYQAKQRRADLQALEKEEEQVREKATADGKANVQKEIQRYNRPGNSGRQPRSRGHDPRRGR